MEVGGLRKELDEAGRRESEVREGVEEREREIRRRLGVMEGERERAVEMLEREKKEFGNIVEEKNSDLCENLEILKKKQDLVGTQQNLIKNLEISVKELTDKKSELDNTVQALAAQLEAVQKSAQTKTETLARQENMWGSQISQIERLNSSIKSLNAELESQKLSTQNLFAENSDFSHKIFELQSAAKTHQSRLLELTISEQNLKSQFLDSQSHSTAQKSRIESLKRLQIFAQEALETVKGPLETLLFSHQKISTQINVGPPRSVVADGSSGLPNYGEDEGLELEAGF